MMFRIPDEDFLCIGSLFGTYEFELGQDSVARDCSFCKDQTFPFNLATFCPYIFNRGCLPNHFVKVSSEMCRNFHLKND